jgi:hypothetical protein
MDLYVVARVALEKAVETKTSHKRLTLHKLRFASLNVAVAHTCC